MLAFDASTYGLATATSLTFSHTCTGSDLILIVGVCVHTINNPTITGITYNGVALTKITENDGTSNQHIELWYLISPATGAHNVVISDSASGSIRAYAASYTGANQTGQPDAYGIKDEASVTSFSQSLTSIADNCWAVWAFTATAGAALTAGANTVVRHQPEVTAYGFAYCDSGAAKTPPGTDTLNVTSSSQSFFACMATIKPTVAAPYAYAQNFKLKTLYGLEPRVVT